MTQNYFIYFFFLCARCIYNSLVALVPIFTCTCTHSHDYVVTCLQLQKEVERWELETGNKRPPCEGATENNAAGPTTADLITAHTDKRDSNASTATDAEVQRLRTNLERSIADSESCRALERSRHIAEVRALQEQLQECETARQELQLETKSLKLRLQQQRGEAAAEMTEARAAAESVEAELRQALEAVQLRATKAERDRDQLEDDACGLENRCELLQTHMQELLAWMGEEQLTKELQQSLTTKMLRELEAVKVCAMANADGQQQLSNASALIVTSTAGASASEQSAWKRRAQEKKDKLLISDLQLNLQLEVLEKQKVTSELSKVKRALSEQET